MIIQHFLRKQGPPSSCMGLLLGTVTEGLVQVCQTLPVNYLTLDENKINLKPFGDSLKAQYSLLRETYPKYSLVGMYTAGDIDKRFITIIQNLEKQYSAKNMILYKFRPTEDGFESQSYLMMRLKLESIAVFKPIPTKIVQAPLDVIVKKERFLTQTVREIRNYLKTCNEGISDRDVALWLGRAENEIRELE